MTPRAVSAMDRTHRRGTALPRHRQLRILMLSIHSSPVGDLGTEDTGGMSVYVRELSGELGRAGHRVDIYTCAGSGLRETELSEGVRLIRLAPRGTHRLSKRNLLGHLPEVQEALEAHLSARRLSYDLIHSHYWLSGCLGQALRSELRTPHLVMFHTTGMAKQIACGQDKEPAFRLVSEQRLAYSCDRVLAASHMEADLLAKYYRVPRKKIGLTPCGVDLSLFRPLPRDAARRTLGLGDESPIVLYVGRFAPVKGLDRLIAAAAHLRRRRDFTLIIIGGDGQGTRPSAELARLAKRGALGATVKLAGRVDHSLLPVYYSAADVVAVSSYYESFSLVTLESLACGTPVVATRVGAAETLIREGSTGLLVDRPSPRSIAHALDRVLRASSEGAMPREGIRASVLGYGWRDVAAAVTGEYDAVLRTCAPEQR